MVVETIERLSEISVVGAELPNAVGFMAYYDRVLREHNIPYHLLFCGGMRVCILVDKTVAPTALSDLHRTFIEDDND